MHFRVRVRMVGSQYVMAHLPIKQLMYHWQEPDFSFGEKRIFCFVFVTALVRTSASESSLRLESSCPPISALNSHCVLFGPTASSGGPSSANKMSEDKLKFHYVCVRIENGHVSWGGDVCGLYVGGGKWGWGDVKEQPFEQISVFKNTLILLQQMPFGGRH